jgi:hypothetical protein
MSQVLLMPKDSHNQYKVIDCQIIITSLIVEFSIKITSKLEIKQKNYFKFIMESQLVIVISMIYQTEIIF